jgi:hypothetical protein
MFLDGRLLRAIGWVVVPVMMALWGCGSTGGAAVMQGGAQGQDQGDVDPADETTNGMEPAEYVAFNDGGGDMADRLGGSTYAGQVEGPVDSGSLRLTFSPEGVLLSMGGTVLGGFFGLPTGADVIFDYEARAVTGTYQDTGGGTRSLEDFLAETGQSIDLRGVVANLTGDSLLILTTYSAVVSGHSSGERTISLEATLRFQTNEDLQGGLKFPDYTESQVPTFTLRRQ